MNTQEEKLYTIGCVIMASGLGKRFGSNKLLAPFGEKPLIQWILDKTSFFENRVVVTRHEEIKTLCDSQGIPVLLHNLPGRNDTVRLGIEALSSKGIDACFFIPGDQPLLEKATLQTMIKTYYRTFTKMIRPNYDGEPGSPVLFPSEFFEELTRLPEGKGGNVLLQKYPDRIVTVPVTKKEELSDIDSPEDLKKLSLLL